MVAPQAHGTATLLAEFEETLKWPLAQGIWAGRPAAYRKQERSTQERPSAPPQLTGVFHPIATDLPVYGSVSHFPHRSLPPVPSSRSESSIS